MADGKKQELIANHLWRIARTQNAREAYLVKRRSFPDSDVSRFTFHVSRTVWAVVGLVMLLGLCTLCVSESTAMDIAILQSSDIAAYHEAIAGLKATGPIGAIYTEYDAQGDGSTRHRRGI